MATVLSLCRISFDNHNHSYLSLTFSVFFFFYFFSPLATVKNWTEGNSDSGASPICSELNPLLIGFFVVYCAGDVHIHFHA